MEWKTVLVTNSITGTPMKGVIFTSPGDPVGNPALAGGVEVFGNTAGPLFTSAQDSFISILARPGTSNFNKGALQPLTAMAWIRTEDQGLPVMLLPWAR